MAGVLAVLAAGTVDHIGLHHLAPRSLEVLANGLEGGGDLLVDKTSLALESRGVVVGFHDVLLVGHGSVELSKVAKERFHAVASCGVDLAPPLVAPPHHRHELLGDVVHGQQTSRGGEAEEGDGLFLAAVVELFAVGGGGGGGGGISNDMESKISQMGLKQRFLILRLNSLCP